MPLAANMLFVLISFTLEKAFVRSSDTLTELKNLERQLEISGEKKISGILKATSNGLRQQSFANRAVIKADQSELC